LSSKMDSLIIEKCGRMIKDSAWAIPQTFLGHFR
jgi:hypothetical protein